MTKYTMQKVILLAAVLVVATVAVFAACATTAYGPLLNKNGVVHIPHYFPPSIRKRALAIAFQELGNCANRKLGEINNASNKRFEVSMPLVSAVKEIVWDVWTRYKDVWTAHIGCEDPRLVECSAMIVFPGARDQDWHRDNDYDPSESHLLSIGIALQTITEDMGPLEVVAKTHASADDVDEDIERMYGEKMTCSQNDIVAWDSSLHHRGTGNTSDVPRVVLLFTIASAGPLPDGSTYTLQERYKRGKKFPRMSEVFGVKH